MIVTFYLGEAQFLRINRKKYIQHIRAAIQKQFDAGLNNFDRSIPVFSDCFFYFCVMAGKRILRKAMPGIIMASCFFIGTVTGYLTNDLTAGILIGLGAGLIVMSILRMIRKRNPKPSKVVADDPVE